MTDYKDNYSLSDVTGHIYLFFRHLRKRIWILVLAALVGACLGGLFSTLQKSKYEATTSFILEEKAPGGGGLAGLASQFGFDVGGMTGGSIFAGDNILDILKSKKIIQKVLLSKTDSLDTPHPSTLADLFLDFSGWQKSWIDKPELSQLNFAAALSSEKLTPRQDSVLNEIHNFLLKKGITAERANKKGSIIQVNVVASNSVFARLLAERLVEEAAKLYLDLKTGTAQENIRKMQRRSDSLLALLNSRTYTAAAQQQLDINPGIRTAAVPVEIASRDKAVAATIYTEVTKNLEASKMLLSQQTPVIQVLDHPSPLLPDQRKGKLLLMIIGTMAGLALSVAAVWLTFVLTQQKKPALNNDKRGDAVIVSTTGTNVEAQGY